MIKLLRILPKQSGRGSKGRISVRHQGGRQKQFFREIDFVRNKKVSGRVQAIEYDPNRTAKVALLVYKDGGKGYILAPEGLKVGDKVEAGETVAIEPGNALPLANIPVGTQVHNLEIKPGKGAEMIRSAGSVAVVQGKENGEVVIKLPSGEVRKFVGASYATVGQVVKVDRGRLGKAGRTRLMGIRPRVRGVAMHPGAHPHGGGEGRSGEGMATPKTPWGKPARGVKTRRRRKYSDKVIIKRRRIGYGSKQ